MDYLRSNWRPSYKFDKITERANFDLLTNFQNIVLVA